MANRKAGLNFLTIMTDQQRWDSLSCTGNKIVHTPRLDQLAADGLVFTSATCTYPLCGPSRASMLTGMYAHGHGFRRNSEISEPGMSDGMTTVDELLRAGGYETKYVGKWHTGSSHLECYKGGLADFHEEYKRYIDDKYPFREVPADWKIDRYTKCEYRPVALDDMMVRALEKGYDMPHHNEAGESPFDAESSLTAWTVRQAMDYLKSKPTAPFALTCSILHPHAPLIAPRPYFGMFDPASMPLPANRSDDCRVKKPSAIPDVLPLSEEGFGMYMSLYYGLVKEVDDNVGLLLDALEDSGHAEDTVVLFVSDHGELMGSHGTFSKMKLFEESIRVPLLMRLPGKSNAGSRLSCAATGADIAPTILDFAGIDIPVSMQGRSLRPAIEKDEPSRRREYAYCEFAGQRGIRSNEWKLVLNPFKECNILETSMLYDLVKDPGEQNNLLSASNRTTMWIDKGESLRDLLIGMMEEYGVPATTVETYSQLDL